MNLPSIALMGRRCAGKTTIAQLLAKCEGFEHHSWAAPVRELFALAYDYDVLDPERYAEVKARPYVIHRAGKLMQVTGLDLLQRIGTEGIRDQVDEDFWVKAGVRCLRPNVRYVNDDTRFENEARALRVRGWAIIYLRVSEEERARRLIERGDLDVSVAHRSEQAPSALAGLVVDTTDRTPGETLAEVLRAIATARRAA